MTSIQLSSGADSDCQTQQLGGRVLYVLVLLYR
jgi:hypothetical protein